MAYCRRCYVFREARRLTQNDLGQLVRRSEGTVYVANNSDHDRLIRKDRNFD